MLGAIQLSSEPPLNRQQIMAQSINPSEESEAVPMKQNPLRSTETNGVLASWGFTRSKLCAKPSPMRETAKLNQPNSTRCRASSADRGRCSEDTVARSCFDRKRPCEHRPVCVGSCISLTLQTRFGFLSGQSRLAVSILSQAAPPSPNQCEVRSSATVHSNSR